MPVLGGTANPLLGRTLLNLLEKQRGGTPPETPPDVNLDVERARQLLDPFGFQAPTSDPVYDWGRLASAILGGKGIVLARGSGGRDVLAEIRRQIGPYLRRLVDSPHTYTTEQLKTLHSGEEVTAGMTRTGPITGQGPKFVQWLGQQAPWPEGLPNLVTRIITRPGVNPAVPSHEAAHALGIERLRQRLFGTSVPNELEDIPVLSRIGGRHADILDDPRVHRMIAESLRRWPPLTNYYTTYRHHTASPYTGYGELMNEAWAQRQATRMGVPRTPAEVPTWYTEQHRSALPALRATYANELENLHRTGRLPPTLREGSATEMPLMQRYQDLSRKLSTPNVPNEVLGKMLLDWLQRRGVP